MLVDQGHDVFVYGGPNTDTAATDVVVVSDDERAEWFGTTDWNTNVFDQFDPTHPSWSTMNTRVTDAIADRLEPGDVVGVTMGSAQAPIAAAFPGHTIAEVGVGYAGVLDNTHKCFESYAWMHHLWGRQGIDTGRLFDTVIPNAYDPDDYQPADPDDYLLFLGRMTERKGLHAVAELAKHHRVITAGPDTVRVPGAEHVGVVRGDDKVKLLGRARALISYSLYVEPFGGVAVEAQMCGTPVIATPFGAYPETVVHGGSGYLCHTLAELLAAAKAVGRLDRRLIRARAARRYSLASAGAKYDAWLDRLATLHDRGWYQ